MAPKEGTFASGLGVQLYTEHWEPESPPTACLLFVHGIGDHVGRYRPVFHKLAARGIAVHAFDSLGHGKSGAHPSRGRHNVEKLDELVADVHAFSTHIATAYAPGTAPPLFLCGQSLGGLVAALACLREPTRYRGLVLVAPALDVEWTTTLHVMAAFGGVLAACLPNAALVPAVQTKFLSRDPAVVEAHKKDDLVPQGDAKCRISNEALKGFRGLKARYAEVTTPLLVMHGSADKITSPVASRTFYEAVSSTDKRYISLPDCYHELFTEPEPHGSEAQEALISWVLERAGQPAKL